MVTDPLNELVTLSDELARLKGKPAAVPQAIPADTDLHPDLAAVLATGSYALRILGADLSKVDDFTKDARSRGMRRRALVFARHPRGTAWFASPENHGGIATVLLIDRLAQLKTTEMSLEEFLAYCIETTSNAIAAATAPPPEPEPEAEQDAVATKSVPKLRGSRRVRVTLPDSDGASVLADGKAADLSGPELAYIRWCMQTLSLLSDAKAPDLSRWESRCLRKCGLEVVPAEGDADRARYDEMWDRLTERDRSAPGPVSHQVGAWKLSQTGTWILASNELAVLRKADRATPPRHAPSTEQTAIWKRWMNIVKADRVQLQVV